VTRQVVVLLPIFYILNALMGLNGIIIAPVAADVFAVAVSVWLGWIQFKRFRNKGLLEMKNNDGKNVVAV
jgi:Na+-driven multidrug efflux pump